MANKKQLNILKQGGDIWNQWRNEHQEIQPDLGEANLYGANLSQAHLNNANLKRANLKDASGITIEELEEQTRLLQGAIMPDGSIYR